MLATLADVLAPVSTPEFLDAFRAKKRVHIAASDPTRAETLLSWQEIDTLLSGHALDGNVVVMRDGMPVPRRWYTSNEGKQLNVRTFHDLLSQGVSIVVNDVDRSIPQIGQLLAAIEREMGVFTNVSAYLSFSKGGAFKPHWDIMDVLVVQVHGSKQWRVWNAELPHPVETAEAHAQRSMRVWRRTKRSSWRLETCFSSRAASPTPPPYLPSVPCI
jgi:ribosomal protein L16 Arg81 hydroxylase